MIHLHKVKGCNQSDTQSPKKCLSQHVALFGKNPVLPLQHWPNSFQIHKQSHIFCVIGKQPKRDYKQCNLRSWLYAFAKALIGPVGSQQRFENSYTYFTGSNVFPSFCNPSMGPLKQMFLSRHKTEQSNQKLGRKDGKMNNCSPSMTRDGDLHSVLLVSSAIQRFS